MRAAERASQLGIKSVVVHTLNKYLVVSVVELCSLCVDALRRGPVLWPPLAPGLSNLIVHHVHTAGQAPSRSARAPSLAVS